MADIVNEEIAILLDGVWVDTVAAGKGVRAEPTTIDHGRANWSSEVDPGSCSWTPDNRDGDWSPDNPGGSHYGHLRRYAPVRAGRGSGDPYLETNDEHEDICSTPNDASLQIGGDLDVRIEFDLTKDLIETSAGVGSDVRLAHAHDGPVGWSVEMFVYLGVPGIKLFWYDTTSTIHKYETNETSGQLPWSAIYERTAIRITLDVDDGASDSVARFYYSASGRIGGEWIEIGDGASGVGVTDIDPSTGPIDLGSRGSGSILPNFPGRIFAFELRDGIDGTVVADPDFGAQTAGTTSFDDDAGLTWTVGAGGRITDQRWRFHGELDSMGFRSDLSDRDIIAPFEARGLFHRLGQDDRVRSSIARGLTSDDDDLVQYWPCEESGTHLERYGAAVGTAPMTVSAAIPQPASNNDFLSSDALPVLGEDIWTAIVDTYAASTAWQVSWLMSAPADFTGTSGLVVLRVETDVYQYEIQHQDGTDGNLRVVIFDGSTTIHTHTYTNFQHLGKPLWMALSVEENGANIDVDLVGLREQDTITAGFAHASAATSTTAGQVKVIQVNRSSACEGWAIGHVALHSAEVDPSNFAAAFAGHRGETAANRVKRLCIEEGLDFQVYGDPDLAETMGPQRPDTILDLLRECARTDIGILSEARDRLAVRYRTRASMLAQGDRLADPTGLVAWWSTGDIVTADQQVMPNRVTTSDVAESTLGSTTGSGDSEDPTVTIGDPTRIDFDGVNDYASAPYTPTITASTGALTVIFVGYWTTGMTAGGSERILSFESADFDGLLLHSGPAARDYPRVHVGGSSTTAFEDPDGTPSLDDGDLFGMAAVIDAGTLYVQLDDGARSAGQDITGVGTVGLLAGKIARRGNANTGNSDVGFLDTMIVERVMAETETAELIARLKARAQLGVVPLDYTNLHASLEPTRDGQLRGNIVTAENRIGGDATAILDDGSALSISAPPTGAGPRPQRHAVNASAATLQDIADRLLALSTVDEPRITSVPIKLHAITDATLLEQLFDMTLGDLLTIDGPPTQWNGGAQAAQLVQGTRELIGAGNVEHSMTLLTSPASPWRRNDLLTVSTALAVSGVNNTRGTGGPRTVTNPVQSTGNTIIFGAIAAGPSQIATGQWDRPDSDAVVIFDHPGHKFVPRVRLWAWEEDGSANYTGGWSATADLQSDFIIGLDGVASDLVVSAAINDNKTDADYPAVATSPGDLALSLDIQQGGSNELTAGPPDWTEEWNDTDTNSPRAFAVHSILAVGTTTRPGNGVWDLGDNAHMRITIGARR